MSDLLFDNGSVIINAGGQLNQGQSITATILNNQSEESWNDALAIASDSQKELILQLKAEAEKGAGKEDETVVKKILKALEPDMLTPIKVILMTASYFTGGPTSLVLKLIKEIL